MSHIDAKELEKKLETAREQVGVGSRYRHYKGFICEVIELALQENTEEIAVIYRHPDDKVIWIRNLADWQSKVTNNEGHTVKRFEKV